MPIKQKGGQKRGLFLVVIGSLITIVFSSMLIHGVRKVVWIANVSPWRGAVKLFQFSISTTQFHVCRKEIS